MRRLEIPTKETITSYLTTITPNRKQNTSSRALVDQGSETTTSTVDDIHLALP